MTRRRRVCLSRASRTGVPILPRVLLLRCLCGAPGRPAGLPGLQRLQEQRLRFRHGALPGASCQGSCSHAAGRARATRASAWPDLLQLLGSEVAQARSMLGSGACFAATPL